MLGWVAIPPPGVLPQLMIEHTSPASPTLAGGFFTWEAQAFNLSVLLSIYPEEESLDLMVVLFLILGEPPYHFPQAAVHLTLPPAVCKGSISPHRCQYLLFSVFFFF